MNSETTITREVDALLDAWRERALTVLLRVFCVITLLPLLAVLAGRIIVVPWPLRAACALMYFVLLMAALCPGLGLRRRAIALIGCAAVLEVVGEATNGEQTVEMVRKLRPAVIVMDISMPKLNGLDATQQILQVLPATKVLICSAHSGEAYVERAMAEGAAGYINKLTSAKTLAAAIRAVQQGNTFLSPAIAKIFSKRRHTFEKKLGVFCLTQPIIMFILCSE